MSPALGHDPVQQKAANASSGAERRQVPEQSEMLHYPLLSPRQQAVLKMQQTRGNAAVLRSMAQRQATPDATIQRDEPGESTDERANDPNFLLCLALCELGIPAPLWRNLMRDLLELVSAEYNDRYGQVRGSTEFQSFRREFQAYSTFNLLKFVLTLLVQGKIGPILVIRSAGARAIQERILARLAAAGLRTTGMVAAEQIIRKISVYIELAVAAGCTAYCGTVAYANTMMELTNGMVAALVDTVNLLNAVGQAGASIMGQIFVRPVLVARASVDATNWDTTALPGAAIALQLVGNLLWSQMEPNDPNRFLTNSQRLMSSFGIPANVLQEIAAETTRVVQARGGFNAAMTFTPDFCEGCRWLALCSFYAIGMC